MANMVIKLEADDGGAAAINVGFVDHVANLNLLSFGA